MRKKSKISHDAGSVSVEPTPGCPRISALALSEKARSYAASPVDSLTVARNSDGHTTCGGPGKRGA